MIKSDSHDLVAGPLFPVPRAMERREDITFVLRWKLIAGVKTKVQRSRMRLHEYIRNYHAINKIHMFSLVFRIIMVANVKPWPAVESTRFYAADVIRWQILADVVPLVRAHPKLV